MTKSTIMLVSADADELELVQSNLKAVGYVVHSAATAQKALQKIRSQTPQLIVLDLALPDMGGLDLCKLLKREAPTKDVPVLILANWNSELDRILALEFGAEECISKPFSPRELIIRVERLLKTAQPPATNGSEGHFAVGILSIDVPRHEVTVAGKRIVLTPTEFKLLTLLAQRGERVQSRDQLLHDVWGYDSDTTSRTVDTHMRRLRSKLGRAAEHLHTVRGFGYRFVA